MVITINSKNQAVYFLSDLRVLQETAGSLFHLSSDDDINTELDFDAKLNEMINDLNEEIENM